MAEHFGAQLRRARERRGISLRRFAKSVGMSATYLSKVERGDLPPPSEKKLKAIAQHLGDAPDLWIVRADRIPSDVITTIRRMPQLTIALVRAVAQIGPRDLKGVVGRSLAPGLRVRVFIRATDRGQLPNTVEVRLSQQKKRKRRSHDDE